MAFWIVLAAAAAGGVPAAIPARGSADFDIQCMIATQQAAGQVSGTTKDQLGLATMYYFGRADSDLRTDDALRAKLRADGKLLEGQELSPLLKQCGEFMGARGQVMVDIGKALEAEEGAAKAK